MMRGVRRGDGQLVAAVRLGSIERSVSAGNSGANAWHLDRGGHGILIGYPVVDPRGLATSVEL